MIKRMLTVLWAIGVITLVGLGVSNKAKADTGVYDGGYSCSNFTITLLDTVYREGGSTYIYEYTITSGAVDISKRMFLMIYSGQSFQQSSKTFIP